jgi:hypothetical protein
MNAQKIRFALALPAGILVMAAFTSFFENFGKRFFEIPQSMRDAIALMQKADPGARDAIAAAMHTPSLPRPMTDTPVMVSTPHKAIAKIYNNRHFHNRSLLS